MDKIELFYFKKGYFSSNLKYIQDAWLREYYYK